MKTENERTLDFYNKHADLYLHRNQVDYSTSRGLRDDRVHQDYIRKTLNNLPKDAKMFEVGSGDGRDAKLINSLGYKIQVSDAVDSFIKILTENGFSPLKFNIVTDSFPDSYDYILANAVLVHLTKSEVKDAIKKVYAALNQNGIFATSFKQRLGGGEDWKANITGTSEKRFFSYWDINEARKMLEEAGFKILHFQQNGGMRACWIDFIVKK